MAKKLREVIRKSIEKKPEAYQGYNDLYSVIVQDGKKAYDDLHWLRGRLSERLRETGMSRQEMDRFFNLYKAALKLEAKDSFDCYMQYLELNRPAEERFYLPRRKQLLPIVSALQELADGKIKELFLSQPPRTGKTTLVLMYMTWRIGREPESTNLYSAFSDKITTAFYEGTLEILTDPSTYLWGDVFQGHTIASKNAADLTMCIDRRRRYASLTCRSIAGSLNGSVDADGLVIADDVVSGYEEALSKDRMIKLWGIVDNNLITRAKQGAQFLWMGTRWSLFDPIGMRLSTLEEDPAFKDRPFKVINVPALDENDESNFDYDYGVGFDTEYYRQRRASFERNSDTASWLAQYMGQPIERAGTLFDPDELRYFNGVLPEGIPDRIAMAVDPAFGGGDFTAAPIGYQYGDTVYIMDVVYSNEDKTKTQPEIVDKIRRYGIQAVQIEANKTIAMYTDGVNDLLKKDGIRVNLINKPAPTNVGKVNRIYDKAPDIRNNFVFLDHGLRSREYEQFMQNVYMFTVNKKVKHDDAPDSLAMFADMLIHDSSRTAMVFGRMR